MKNREKVLFLLLSALLLAGCSSLPLPGSPTESLFILAGDVDRNLIDRSSNIYHVDSVKLVLLNQETGEREELFFHPGDDYIAIPLEPGRYSFEEDIIISFKSPQGEAWINEQPIQPADYLIEKNVVYLSTAVLEIKKQNIGEGAHFSFAFTSGINAPAIKDRTMNQVLNEWHYRAWDLSPIIGWEKPEEDS